jgi:hypothetical protein
MSVNRTQVDFVLFFNFEHPGMPGSQCPVAQVALPVSALKLIHEISGRALEYMDTQVEQAEAGPVELPSNVFLFSPREPKPDP